MKRSIRRLLIWTALRMLPADVLLDMENAAEVWWSAEACPGERTKAERLRHIRLIGSRWGGRIPDKTNP